MPYFLKASQYAYLAPNLRYLDVQTGGPAAAPSSDDVTSVLPPA